MNNDLISRSALKEAISDIELSLTNKRTILGIIDNTPTAEPKLKGDIIEAFNLITDQEFEHSDSFWVETPKGKKIEFEKKRPQGEWVPLQAIGDYKCSICGYENLYKYVNEHERWVKTNSNFCPNCGAPMKGGAV